MIPLLGQVLIVPLWNWNYDSSLDISEVTACFNRTFMELKYDHDFSLHTLVKVLIVPLWNWNDGTEIDTSGMSEF